jgi:hypothetical protein
MFAGDGSKHCNFILLEHHVLSALKSQLVSLWSSAGLDSLLDQQPQTPSSCLLLHPRSLDS